HRSRGGRQPHATRRAVGFEARGGRLVHRAYGRFTSAPRHERAGGRDAEDAHETKAPGAATGPRWMQESGVGFMKEPRSEALPFKGCWGRGQGKGKLLSQRAELR